MKKDGGTLFRLLRTIVYVVTNPERSLAWKIIDSIFLTFLAGLVLACLIEPWGGGVSLSWLALYFFLLPWVIVVTQRSWYELPGFMAYTNESLALVHIMFLNLKGQSGRTFGTQLSSEFRRADRASRVALAFSFDVEGLLSNHP